MPAITDTKYLTKCSMSDVPHLNAAVIAAMKKDIPPHLVDARMNGDPSLGSGAIYPVAESDIRIAPFEIPDHWPRAYGLDVGWNRTACIWGAINPDEKTVYLYTEHYRGHADPATHADAIKVRGAWIPGTIDPASRASGQKDGDQLYRDYVERGLLLTKANNAVESGLQKVYSRLTGGTLKVFATCQNWFAEFRLYRRDEEGKIIKEFDHLMDATRYLIVSGLDLAICEPIRPRTAPNASRGDAVIGY